MNYDFHAAQEFGWAVFTGAGLAAVQLLSTAGADKLYDRDFWVITLGGAVIRAAAGAVIDWSKNHQPPPQLSEEQIRAIIAEEMAKPPPLPSPIITP